MKKLKLISLILVVVMLASMLPIAGMLSAFAAEDEPVASDDWFTRETKDDTPYELDINDAKDLLAFAEKLSEGTSSKPAFFAVDENGNDVQYTVHLRAHIILNDGWNCMGVESANKVAVPATIYPVASGAMFGGIFDGHGHVLSGLYVNGTQNVGLFGNVPSGYTATVKNVIVKNSFVQGNGIAIGTIFGTIEDKPWDETHTSGRYGKATKATLNNVYVESVVSGTTQANGNLGTGGLVGGIRADMDVINCSYVGTVFGGIRGTGAVIGSFRTKEMDTNIVTYDYSNSKYHFYPNLSQLYVEKAYLQAHLVSGGVAKSQGGAGAIVGYINDASATVKTNDVVTCCTFGTKGVMAEKDASGTETGNYIEEVKNSKSYTDTAFKTNDSTDGKLVETRDYYERSGYLWGFTHSAGKSGMNNVPYDKNSTTNQTQFAYMTLDLTDTYYVKSLDNKIKYEGFAYSTDKAETVFKINGTLVDVSYDTATGEITNPNLFGWKNWDAYAQAVELKKQDNSVQLPVLHTNIAEISYYGEPRMYEGVQQYASVGERKSQLVLNMANDAFGLAEGSNDDWATTLSTKMTGLNASDWAEWGDYLLPKGVADMVAGAKEAMDMPSATPTVDADWYANETEGENKNLVIYNADDLLGFAAAIEAGNTFDGMTVTLSTNVTLNAGWDAFAETVTAPETVWPLASANKGFAGTFDGNGKTISGIYLSTTGDYVGIFGNVKTGTAGTVKNVKIENSYVTTNCSGNKGGLGGIFGQVEDESTTVITDNAYVNKTKAVVDNVYANIHVVNTGNKNNSNLGTGGIVGGARADVFITNTVFVGTVNGGGIRGTAAFIGAIRPLEASGTQAFRTVATIENCYSKATLIDTCGFVGGAVGYSNTITTHTLKNVLMDNTIQTTSASKSGYIFGCTYWAGTNDNRVGAGNVDPMFWNMENVYYIENTFEVSGTATKMYPMGNLGAATFLNNDTNFKLAKQKEYTDEEVKGDASAMGLAPATAEEAYFALTALDSWTDANGQPLPTKIFDTFYVGFVGQSVTLGNTLEMNIYVKMDGAQQEYTGTFAFQTADNVSEVLSEHMGNNVHKFTLTDITAAEMGDTIAFAYGEAAGQSIETSVQDYLVALMASDAELASAMLHYGAAAQVAADYNTDKLVNDVEGILDAADTTADLTNDATFEGTESEDWYVKGVELFMDKGVMKLRVKCFFRDLTLQQGVSIAVDGREKTIHLDFRNMTPVETENRTYTAVFNNFDMASVNADIALAILEREGGTVYSQVMVTDFDDLVADFLASDAADADKALVKAMHAVSVALAD